MNPMLFLTSREAGWTSYVRYDGDDEYMIHCSRGRGRRDVSLRFLSREAAAEYLVTIYPDRVAEAAILLTDMPREEDFTAYDEVASKSSCKEVYGEDVARCCFRDVMRLLLILRDGRCS